MDYIFCNAKERLKCCRIKTNLCCIYCRFNAECLEFAKKYKLQRPCVVDNFEEDEKCEFLI